MEGGSVRLTGDGVVGPSGKAIRLYSVVAMSGAGGAGTLVLRNGTADTATAYVTEDATAASKSKTYNFGTSGLVFPGGCFFDIDANIAAAVFNYVALQS